MPAYHASSSFTSSASLSEEHCCPQSSFNRDGRVFRRGEGFHPYPQEQEVFLRSNTDSVDDKSWHELGLNNFVITNIRIGRHRFNRYSDVMVVRADLKSNHLVTKRCPLLPWNSGVAAGVLVGPN